jgi:hypothetical protein
VRDESAAAHHLSKFDGDNDVAAGREDMALGIVEGSTVLLFEDEVRLDPGFVQFAEGGCIFRAEGAEIWPGSIRRCGRRGRERGRGHVGLLLT